MKAEIKKDGNIHIIAETITEGFALRAIFSLEEPCENCGQCKTPVVINASILNKGN